MALQTPAYLQISDGSSFSFNPISSLEVFIIWFRKMNLLIWPSQTLHSHYVFLFQSYGFFCLPSSNFVETNNLSNAILFLSSLMQNLNPSAFPFCVQYSPSQLFIFIATYPWYFNLIAFSTFAEANSSYFPSALWLLWVDLASLVATYVSWISSISWSSL